MKFSLWTRYGALNSKPVFDAFRASLRALDYEVVENSHDADVDVIWSVLWSGRMSANKSMYFNSKPTIVLEVGGILRGVTWKVGLDGIGRSGCVQTVGNNSERAEHLGLELHPGPLYGENILICCQNPKSQLWEGMPTTLEWLDTTIKTVRKYSERPIVVRPHPRVPLRTLPKYKNVKVEQPKKIPGSYDDFDLTFANTHAVINWSSNPGPQAVLNGVPVFTGPESLAYDVANTNLSYVDNPILPDRQQWLNDYAHTEFTLNEISQGIPLRNLLKTLDFRVKRL